MLKDMDIIKVHQTTKDFILWYAKSIDTLAKYMTKEEAKQLVQYSMMEALDECVRADFEEIEKVCKALFQSVKEENYVENMSSFFSESPEYCVFMENYRMNRHVKVSETGRFWLKLVDSLAENKEKTEELLDDLIPFISWTYSYVQIFAYQYVIEYYGSVEVNRALYVPYNYWELKEVEQELDTYSEGNERKVNEYINREELLYELIRLGVFLPQAIKITRRIRKGKQLKDAQKELLLSLGMVECEKLNEIRYLPSIAGTFLRVFSVNKLI